MEIGIRDNSNSAPPNAARIAAAQTQDARPMPIAAQRQYVNQIRAVRDAARN